MVLSLLAHVTASNFFSRFLRSKALAGLDVATRGVANETKFYSVATNFSHLGPVARSMASVNQRLIP